MGIQAKLKNTLDTIKNNPSFTVKEQLGFAGGMFGNAMGQDCVYTYSDKFNRDFLNIRPVSSTIGRFSYRRLDISSFGN